MKLKLWVFFGVLGNLQTWTCSSLLPGTYRIIGAEGEASLTTGTPQSHALAKLSMKFWNGTTTPAQKWSIGANEAGEMQSFSLVNLGVLDNVLSLQELNGDFRSWKMLELGKGNLQIKDAGNGRCLTRLGVTVYDEGTLCDTQAQSQQWKFLPI